MSALFPPFTAAFALAKGPWRDKLPAAVETKWNDPPNELLALGK
jgi:hypothetical protein